MCTWRNVSALLLLLTATVRAQSIDGLTIIAGSGPKTPQIRGEPGRQYVIQGSSELRAETNWEVLQQLMVVQPLLEWIDTASASMPHRFYRMIKSRFSHKPRT